MDILAGCGDRVKGSAFRLDWGLEKGNFVGFEQLKHI